MKEILKLIADMISDLNQEVNRGNIRTKERIAMYEDLNNLRKLIELL